MLDLFSFCRISTKIRDFDKEKFSGQTSSCLFFRHFAWMITLYRYLFHGLSILKLIIFCSFNFDIFHVRLEKGTISYHYFQECLFRSFISKCNGNGMKGDEYENLTSYIINIEIIKFLKNVLILCTNFRI